MKITITIKYIQTYIQTYRKFFFDFPACGRWGKVKKTFLEEKEKEVEKTFSSITLVRDQNFYDLKQRFVKLIIVIIKKYIYYIYKLK